MVESTALIAAWNASGTIARAVDSVLSQTDIAAEAIVADDLSGDDTLARAQAAGARVIGLAQNGGPSAARNRAIEAAQGDWLAVLDSDDAMAPGRLRAMIDLARREQADLVLGNLQRVDETGLPYDEAPFLSGPGYDAPKSWTMEQFLADDMALTGGRSLGYLKPLIRRSFLKDHGIRYDPRLRNGEDCFLVLECLAAGARVIFSPRPDYLYTVRRGSISHRIDPAHIEALITVENEFVMQRGSDLSARTQALFKTRIRNLARLKDSEIVLQALKASKFASIPSTLYHHPAATGRVVRQLIQALRNRVTS